MGFKEDDIRPPDLNAGKEEAFRQDLRWLQSRQERFVEVDCPACDGTERRTAFAKHGFRFVECSSCETVYMSPRGTPQILGEFYARSALYTFWNRHIFPASREVRREKIMRPRARRMIELAKEHGSGRELFVDVGASCGLMCEEVRAGDYFREIVAVEPSAEQAESCRQAGFRTVESVVENVDELRGRVNAVTAFEVVEHLHSPRTFLEKCRELLAPGGLIVVTCPNYRGFDIQTLGVRSDSLDAEHINLFHPGSLRLLFSRCGFHVIECDTPGELDAEIVRTRSLAGDDALDDQPLLRHLLLEEWEAWGERFQGFLRHHRLSSHMRLAAVAGPGAREGS